MGNEDSEEPEGVGRLIRLSEGRLVFVGAGLREPDTFRFGFRNSDGDDLTFKLSQEAALALRSLLMDPSAGERVTDFPHQKKTLGKWVVVNEVS